MKAIEIKSSGFGKQLFEAETVEGGIDAFKKHAERCAKQNSGTEPDPLDMVIKSVRVVGTIINHP